MNLYKQLVPLNVMPLVIEENVDITLIRYYL